MSCSQDLVAQKGGLIDTVSCPWEGIRDVLCGSTMIYPELPNWPNAEVQRDQRLE